MQNLVPYVTKSGDRYDIPPDQEEAFRADFGEDAQPAASFRTKDGESYHIPQSMAEDFRKDFPDAQPTRRLSFANGTTRDFTSDELREFMAREYRESDDYKADRDEVQAKVDDVAKRAREKEEEYAKVDDGRPKPAAAAMFGSVPVSAEDAQESADAGRYMAKNVVAPYVKTFLTDAMRLQGQAIASGNPMNPSLAGGQSVSFQAPKESAEFFKRGADVIDSAFAPTKEEEEAVGPAVRAIGNVESKAQSIGAFALALHGLGKGVGNVLMSAEAGNDTYLSLFDTGTKNGLPPEEAHKWAISGSAVATLGTAALGALSVPKFMQMGVPEIEKGASMNGYRDLVRNAMVGNVKRYMVNTAAAAGWQGSIMGAESLFSAPFEQKAQGKDVDWVEAWWNGAKSTAEGFGIGLFMGGIGFLDYKRGVRMGIEAQARQAAGTEEGRTAWRAMFPDGARNLIEKRVRGEDITRSDIERAGFPEMSKAERNAVADAYVEDAAKFAAENAERIKAEKDLRKGAEPVEEPAEPTKGEVVPVESKPAENPAEKPPEPPPQKPPENAPQSVPPPEGTTTPPEAAKPPQAAQPPESAAPAETPPPKDTKTGENVNSETVVDTDENKKPTELPTDERGRVVGEVGDSVELEDGMKATVTRNKSGRKKWTITQGKRWTVDYGKTWHDGMKVGERFSDKDFDDDKVPSNVHFNNHKNESGIWEVEFIRKDGSYELKPVPAAEVPAKTETGGNQGDAAQQLPAVNKGKKPPAAAKSPPEPKRTFVDDSGKTHEVNEDISRQLRQNARGEVNRICNTKNKTSIETARKQVKRVAASMTNDDLSASLAETVREERRNTTGGKASDILLEEAKSRGLEVTEKPKGMPQPGEWIVGRVDGDSSYAVAGRVISADARGIVVQYYGGHNKVRAGKTVGEETFKALVPTDAVDLAIRDPSRPAKVSARSPAVAAADDFIVRNTTLSRDGAAVANDDINHQGEVKPPPRTEDEPRKPFAKPLKTVDAPSVAKEMAGHASQDETRKGITGVHVEKGQMVATDGRRMVIAPAPKGMADGEYGADGKPVGDDRVYPNWRQVVPDVKKVGYAKIGTVANGDAATDAVDFASALRKKVVAVTKYDNDAPTVAIGDAACDPSYVSDILGTMFRLGAKSVDVWYRDGKSPVVFKGRNADGEITSVLMPLRSNGESAAERGFTHVRMPLEAPKPKNKGKGKKAVQAAKALGSPDAASPLRPAPKGAELVQGELDGWRVEEMDAREGTNLAGISRLVQEAQDSGARPRGRQEHFNLSKTPEAIKEVLPGEYFTVKAGVVLDHYGKDADHSLSPQDWVNISEALHDPLVIAKYSTPRKDGTRYYPPNSFRVWVEALVNGHRAMVGVEVKSPGRDVSVNSVSTVYGDEHVSLNPDDVVYSRGNGEGTRTLLGGPNPREYSGSLPASEPTIPVDKTSRRPSADRSADNSASRRPTSGDNAEGNSPETASILPRPGGEVKGGAEKPQKTLDGQTIDPTGEKTDRNPLGKALVPKDGSIEQEVDAEIAADEALAAKGGGKPQGVPPAPAPGSAGNPNLDPSYEPEAFGSGIEGNPIARQQVIDKFRELFGDKVAIRGKNTRTLGPTVAGHFEPDAHIIRSKDPISLRTIPHEIGHFIDALLRRRGLARPPAVRHDLIALGKLLYGKKQPNGGYESEGFAELLKYYMQGNDAGLRKDAPAAYDWFMNRFAPANPDTMARIDAMRDMIDRFQNQSAVQAVRGISAPDRTLGQKIVDRIADAANALKPTQENWIDKGAFITKAMKASGINRLYDWRDALKRGDVAEATRIIENHPVLKWKLYNGKAGMRAFVALKDGLTDLSGTRRYTYGDLGVTTPGHAPDEPLPTFREIFGDFTKRELDDFKHEYAIARVAKELYLDRGLEFGLTEREVNTVLRKYANNTKFRDALDRYTHYKHGVLHLLVDAGAMSQRQFEAIVDANPIYAKIARRRESTDFFRNAMLRRGGKAVNERKGGGQMVEDIFDAGLVDDERIFRAAFQADLFRSLVRAGELAEANNAAPGGALQGTFSVGANWIKEVPNAKEAVTFTPEKLRKQVVDALNAAGAEAPSNVAGQPPLRGDTLFDALFGTGDNLTIFKERPSDGKNGIVSIYGEDGKLRTFELPENNAEGWAKGLLDFTDGKNASILEKWAEISVAGVRSGATMLNPEFALRNLMRDTFHAATLNQHGTFIPVVGSLEGLYHDLMGTAPKQMFEAMGLEMGGMLGRSRLASARKSNQYLMSSNWLEAQMRKGLTKAVADLVGVTENATRIKQFKLAYENMLRQGVSDKAAKMIAGCNALDTTIDFLRSGYAGQGINRVVPFFNAGVQGLDQFARALGMLEPKAWDVSDSRFVRAGRTLLQGLAFLATLALFSELYNRSDPERKRKAEELSPHERWNYISFGDLRIPVPYEAGYLFASIPRAVAAAAIDGDDRSVPECLKMFATTFPLQVDSLHGFMRNAAFVGPLADVAFNEDWKHKTIVQQYVKDGKESWEWYGPRTTGFSKDLGKALHKVIGDSYFSAPAYLDTIFDGYTGGMYSKLARLAYGEADFSFDTSRPSDWPIIGTFSRPPESSRIPNDFYDERAKLERKAGSGTATIAEYGRLSAMDSIAKDIRPYWDANRRLMADRDMPRKERLDRMDENTRKATDAIRAMSDDEGVMRDHGMKALAAKLANPTATGDSWERAAKMLKADGATLSDTQKALRLYGRAHGWSRDTANRRLRLLTARWK